ncbi:metalloprotease [Lacinutrix neustonica]|uniref:Metalloprotease n=1 Tax=Lacinutrix neustonica TaxID=2980107 RepID=A0A9E8MW22_9FLAO|nr:metalloprotease [Lacinutrix neustonica]WAC02638.1 metalloprotease [Lacinutrix neustonica]
MKTTKTNNLFLMGVFTLATVLSCSTDENETEAPMEAVIFEKIDESISETQKECGYVDGNWSSTAYLTTNWGSTTKTNFMNSQNSKIAAVWGRPAVTLRLVKDNSNPGSTYNALSYGSGKIYYGDAIYKDALSKGGNIVNAMILAHEFGHQLQFTYNYPSVNENTARAGELEADGMAGYYLRRPTGYNKTSFSQIASAYDFAASIGDNCTTCPSHHGKDYQRRSAVRLGFLLGAYSLNASSFDYNFFYYYSGVLNGQYRQVNSEYFDAKLDAYIRSHIDELARIQSGEMTDEEYFELE